MIDQLRDIEYNINMSSNKFLQRFQGKIQVVGKQGVQNVFGGKNDNVIVYTNNNFNQPNKNKTSASLNKPKAANEVPKESKVSQKNIPNHTEGSSKKQTSKQSHIPPNKQKKVQNNPFLISNPFYLDEEDKERIQKQRKQRELQQKQERQREKQALKLAQQQQDAKKNTTNNLNKSLQKKKNQKQWVKLGGLGANIGGEDWMQKKKKLDKMQEFSQQVKSINKDKPKVPKQQKKQEKKDNTRQKALEYSKNVPKPVVRMIPLQRQQEVVEEKPAEEQLTQLQLYQLKHQKYKNMLKNQL